MLAANVKEKIQTCLCSWAQGCTVNFRDGLYMYVHPHPQLFLIRKTVNALDPLPPHPQALTIELYCCMSTSGRGLWTCSTQKYQMPIEGGALLSTWQRYRQTTIQYGQHTSKTCYLCISRPNTRKGKITFCPLGCCLSGTLLHAECVSSRCGV